jgi:hypothetical protein
MNHRTRPASSGRVQDLGEPLQLSRATGEIGHRRRQLPGRCAVTPLIIVGQQALQQVRRDFSARASLGRIDGSGSLSPRSHRTTVERPTASSSASVS